MSFDTVARSDASARDDNGTPIDSGVTFAETFDRADSAILGNGWTQKTVGTFGITSGAVVRRTAAGDYRDLIVTRPLGEDLLDVEVAIEFTVGHLPPGYPQVHARVQRGSIATANTLDGYLLYINGTSGNGLMEADLTQQHGSILPAPMTTFPLSPQLALGETYRLRLSVRGTAPVMITGVVEHKTGSAYTLIGNASTADSSGTAVVTAGAVGFAAGQPEDVGYYTYDAFTYLAL